MIIILFIILIVFLGRSFYEKNTIEISNFEFKDKRIGKKLRLVYISDLHGRKFDENNSIVIGKIRALKPDYVIIGGDLLDKRNMKSIDASLHFVQRLGKEFRTYYSFGNHEKYMLLHAKKLTEDYLEKCSRYTDFIVGRTEHLAVSGVNLIGYDFSHDIYKASCKGLDCETVEGIGSLIKSKCFNILLAHDPYHFSDYSKTGVDLVLSGHIHGGVVRLPDGRGLLSPRYTFFPKYSAGLYMRKGTKMIVSRGLGNHSVPVRINNKPEIVCIDLIPE